MCGATCGIVSAAGRARCSARLFLDAQHRLIAFREMFLGTLDSATVHPREVLRETLVLNAAAVILVHNHPSGVAEPSASDVKITERLRHALQLIDVRVLDHVVVTPAMPYRWRSAACCRVSCSGINAPLFFRSRRIRHDSSVPSDRQTAA